MVRTAKRDVWPYRHSEQAFETIALRLDEETPFDPAQTSFVVEVDHGGVVAQEALDLEVSLDFKEETLLADVDLPRNDVDVVLILEHPRSRMATVESRWPLGDVPRRHSIHISPSDYSGRELTLRIAALLNREREEGDGRAWRLGSTLAERTFSIHYPLTASLFPVENTSFKDMGWDENALWFVRFRSLESAWEEPPQDVVEVHMNKDLPALQFLWSTSATRRGSAIRVGVNMVRQVISADILTDMAIPVLAHFYEVRKDDPEAEPEPRSLTAVMKNLLSDLNEPWEQVLDMAAHSPGELTRKIQHRLGVGKAFNEVMFRDWTATAAKGDGE